MSATVSACRTHAAPFAGVAARFPSRAVRRSCSSEASSVAQSLTWVSTCSGVNWKPAPLPCLDLRRLRRGWLTEVSKLCEACVAAQSIVRSPACFCSVLTWFRYVVSGGGDPPWPAGFPSVPHARASPTEPSLVAVSHPIVTLRHGSR